MAQKRWPRDGGNSKASQLDSVAVAGDSPALKERDLKMAGWEPLKRVGTPKVEPAGNDSKFLQVTIKVAGPNLPEWREFFDNRTKSLTGGYTSHGAMPYSSIGFSYTVDDADLEKTVAFLDSAIEAANKHYEETVLPAKQSAKEEAAKAAEEAKRLQAELDERAAKLAKPEVDPLPTSRNW